MQMKTLLACILVVASVALTTEGARPLGIDVSSAQGHPNWTSVHGDGVLFAYAKATTGVVAQDADYNYNMPNGKAAGVLMGAYHVAQPDMNTPAAEANYFWNFAGAQIKSDGKTLFPVIDFETFNGHVGSSNYTTWVNSWAIDVKAKTTVFLHPVLYSSPGGMCNLTSACSLQEWVANFNGQNFATGTPWSCCTSCNYVDPGQTDGWTFWQFSDTAAVTGISGNVDFDTYNGTFTQLKANEVIP